MNTLNKNRIDILLSKSVAEGRPVLSPFITIGYPDKQKSIDMGIAILKHGGDMLELGVPFSDPLADGPTIQKTSFKAIQNGINLSKCIDAASAIRNANSNAPLILMGYLNPFLHYGFERFASNASEAGIDGLIIPDVPAEEAQPYLEICDSKNINFIPLLAPTSTDSRIEQSCKNARGFIYCVSVTGITGARTNMSNNLQLLVSKIRKFTELPILVGFGISTKKHFQDVTQFADGAIIASAMLDAVNSAPSEDPVITVSKFIKGIK